MTLIPARRALPALALALAAGPAAAVPLLPGETLGPDAYFDAAVAPGDPAWFGTALAAQTGSASRFTDGFDGFETVEDINEAAGRIESSVSAVPAGTVFAYTFVDEAPVALDGSSTVRATLFGFDGFAVDVAPVGDPDDPYGPVISRSEDGDSILFNLAFDPDFPDDPLSGLTGFATVEIRLRTDAPSFRIGDATLGLGIGTFGVADVAVAPGVLVPAPIPLPAGLPLLALGLGALGLAGRRRKG